MEASENQNKPVETPVVDKDEKKLAIKKEREEKLKKMKERYKKVQRYNSIAVEMEAKKLNNDAAAKREENEEWRKNQETKRKELKLRGITKDNEYMLESAEEAQKKAEIKKQKEKNAVNSYGWNIFSEDSVYRAYEKRLKNLPTTPESAAASEDLYSDPLDYGTKSRLSKEAIERVVNDQKKRDEKHNEFSRRRTFYNQESVDYINERNRTFNRKLDRYYDRFTSDIRSNLEKGTA